MAAFFTYKARPLHIIMQGRALLTKNKPHAVEKPFAVISPDCMDIFKNRVVGLPYSVDIHPALDAVQIFNGCPFIKALAASIKSHRTD